MNRTGEIVRDQNQDMLHKSTKTRTMLWILLVLIVVLIMIVMSVLSDSSNNPIPNNSRQMIVVRTPSWTASKGFMQCFERSANDGEWAVCGSKVPIILGRNGLAWGRGLHSIPDDTHPVKHEGDGKSPAGVFRLGDAFGIPSFEEIGELNISYKTIDEYLECVDAAESQYYNQLVENNKVEKVDWKSSEHIHRSPNAYHYAVMINHNTEKIQKGAGSCIILHCVSVDGDSTAGCTTMSRDEMENVLKWLDKDKNPVLVQLPESEYLRLKNHWELPDF